MRYMLSFLPLSRKILMKLFLIQIGSLPCKRSSISLKGTRCGTLYHGQRKDQSLAPSGCSEISLTSSEQSLGTRPGQQFKATTKKRGLIIKKPLHLLQRLRLFVFWQLLLLTSRLSYVKWISKVHFSIDTLKKRCM